MRHPDSTSSDRWLFPTGPAVTRSTASRRSPRLDEVDEDRTYLSVITLGELRKGADRLANGQRRDRLDRWLNTDLADRFGNRLLPVDAAIADEWGRMLARAQTAGTAIGSIDGLIAATAKMHGLQVVTRNVTHFQYTGVDVISPWHN